MVVEAEDSPETRSVGYEVVPGSADKGEWEDEADVTAGGVDDGFKS